MEALAAFNCGLSVWSIFILMTLSITNLGSPLRLLGRRARDIFLLIL
jgi:hypothetical protein